MAQRKRQPDGYYLARAEPRYAADKDRWRVRVQLDQHRQSWWLSAGAGDPTAVGKALAFAEWRVIRDRINAATETAVARLQTITPPTAAVAAEPPSLSTVPRSRRMSELLDSWLESLKRDAEASRIGIQDGSHLGAKRLTQYRYSIDHMRSCIGDEIITPTDDYQVSPARLSQLLQQYRGKCREEVAAMHGKRGRSVSWLAEKMKAARKLAGYLVSSRMCPALPHDIAASTAKPRIQSNATPIPLDVLHAIWQVADGRMRTFILLALNCGFRQTEISQLHPNHITMVAGTRCVDKRRNKTGVPMLLPMWDITHAHLTTHGCSSGTFFTFEGDPVSAILNRWRKLRTRAAEAVPAAAEYSFETLRDLGASFIRSQNPVLVPMYLGHVVRGDQSAYLGEVRDSTGHVLMPSHLTTAMAAFLDYLSLPSR